jgi:hypothetical protein
MLIICLNTFALSIHHFSRVNWLMDTELFLSKCNNFYLDDDSRISVVSKIMVHHHDFNKNYTLKFQ